MTNKEEKMIEAITIKLGPSQLDKARDLADAQGMGLAEYIRHLIDRDIEHHRSRYESLARIFGDEAGSDKE